MSMIEGVGDEVTICFGIFSLLSMMILAWLSTHVNDPMIRVIVLDRDTFRRLIRRIRNIQSGGSEPSTEAQPVTNTSSDNRSGQEEQPTTGDDVQTRILVTESNVSPSDSESVPRPDTEPNTTEETTQSVPDTNEKPIDDSSSTKLEAQEPVEGSVPGPTEESAPDRHEPEVSREESPSQELPEEIPEGSLRIKIKYIDDRQKIVFARPEVTVGKFKRDNFSAEISENLAVRFIYNGQELKQDGQTLQAYNVQNDCVIHCLLSRIQQEAPGPQGAHSPDLAIDIGFLMFPLFGLILALIWYCRFTYRNYFNAMSTFSLIGITFLFIIAVLSTFRNHGGEVHEHQD